MDNNNCNQNNHVIKPTEEMGENVSNVDEVDSSKCTVAIEQIANVKLEPMNTKPLGSDETGTRSNLITNNGTTNHNNVTNNGHNKNSVSAAKKNAFYKQQPFDEYFIPVNEHRKFIRGEKLYLTMDKRDNKRGFTKYFCYIAAFLIFFAIVITAVLAAIGIIFNHETNRDYIDQSVSSRQFRTNIKTAGHSISYTNGNRNLSQFQQEPITEPPIIIITTQTSIVTDSYSRFEVPNTLEAHVVITNMDFRPEFANKTSPEYKEFIQELESSLRLSLFDFEILTNGMNTIILRVIDIQPGSIKVKFRVGWMYIDKGLSDRVILTKSLLIEKLQEYSMRSNSEKYQLDPNLINVSHVSNMCKVDNNCDEMCSFDFPSLNFRCACFDGRVSMNCSRMPTTTEIVSTTEEIVSKISTISTTTESEVTTMKIDNEEFEQINDVTTNFVIPLKNDALNHENPIEKNPDMGVIIERGKHSEELSRLMKTTVDFESPTIEMIINEKETTTIPTILAAAITPTQITAAESKSSDFDKDFENELGFESSTINLLSSTESSSIQGNAIYDYTTNEIVTTEYFVPVQVTNCSSTQLECANSIINNNDILKDCNKTLDKNDCEITNKNDSLVCKGIKNFPNVDDTVVCLMLNCKDSEFYCSKEKKCIRNTLKCNGNWDCIETGKDELFCDCSSDQFKCKSGGGCIKKSQVCDGIEQCADLSDEWNCFKISNADNSSIIEIRTMNDNWLPICSTNWNDELNDMLCEKLGFLDSIESDFITKNNTSFKSFQITNDSSKDILKMIDIIDNCDSVLSLRCRKFDCGKHQGSADKIGKDFNRNWPSTAIIYNEINNRKCIGTLIAPKWLISTYSCFSKDENVDNWKIDTGLSSVIQTRDLKRFIIHPQAKYKNLTYENDIILIELKEMFTLYENLSPICLPQNTVHNRLICLTPTWKNDTAYNTDSDLLNLNYVTKLENNTECEDQFNGEIDEDDRICTKKLCNVNEGASIVCFTQDLLVLELKGLLSSRPGCEESRNQDIYTKVNEHVIKWIMNSIGINFDTHTRFQNNF